MVDNHQRGSTIRFNRGVTNALTTEMLASLSHSLQKAKRDSRGIVLCGGEKFFSNGVDLDWALTQSPAEMRDLFLELGKCIVTLLETPIPVVGAIKGHAIGGALAMLLCCDYRYAASGKVLLGKPEVLLGVPNPYYGDQLLRFVAGDYVASDLIYSGRLLRSDEALKYELIHGVEEPAQVESIAWDRVAALCALAPAAFSESKRMRNEHLCARLREQMSARVARQVEIWNSSEAQKRLHAAAERLRK